MNSADTGKDSSALDSSDSVVGREYVMVEKQTVEVNALADGEWCLCNGRYGLTYIELDQASRANQALVRRPSSRISVVSRPVSSLRPAAATSPATEKPLTVPASYSPPFSMSTTPPFAIPPLSSRQPSGTVSRPSSYQQQNIFPPATITSYSPENIHAPAPRYGISPSSLQTGALARALTNTAIRMIGHGANTAATALARASAAAKRRPTIARTGEMDDAEEELLRSVEDVARKAFALFELADSKLADWNALSSRRETAPGSSPASLSPRRKSSSSSANAELAALRMQETAAGEACVLYCKSLGFIVKGTNMIQRYWETTGGEMGGAGVELNESESSDNKL